MTPITALQDLCDAYVVAYRAGDARACAAVFTEDALLFSADAPPAEGRAAIAALHEIWTQGGENKTLTVVDAAGAGEVAWGRAVFAEGAETGEGNSLFACVRSADGPWRIKVCSITAA